MKGTLKPRWSTIYTLTETHPGSEGTRGAIDLPIAREAATGLPFLPDTSLKGVARAAYVEEKGEDESALCLFGSELSSGGDEGGSTQPGALSVLQGSLLLYPLRSLNRMFVYATAPFLLERLERLCRGVGIAPPWGEEGRAALSELLASEAFVEKKALVSDKDLEGTLFVERIALEASHAEPLATLAKGIGAWLPGDDNKSLRARIASNLVLLPDALLSLLLDTAPPVRARIKLNSQGTTEDLQGDSGNLWYEERLPADVLFWTLLVPRVVGRQAREEGDDREDGKERRRCRRPLEAEDLNKLSEALGVVQIGGGATTGHGQCQWHMQPGEG